MANLFLLIDGGVARRDLPDAAPLRLDNEGAVVGRDTSWVVSLVVWANAERAACRYALVAAPNATVVLGAEPLCGGVTDIVHRDHLLIGAIEAIFSADAVPEAVASVGDTPCPVCCEPVGEGEPRALYGCPRCCVRACNLCWRAFPRGVCMTPGCGQPAAIERALWAPELADFVTWEDEP